MKDTKFRILLDIHEVRSQATIPVKVGDVSCKIYITLVEGGKPYKIHENSFGVFTGKKGDDKYLFNNCVIENGIIRYDFTPQTVAAAGVLECEIRIYDEDGGVLTTPSFNIVVDERAVNDSELASASEFAFLDEILVNEGQRIENERNRNEAFNNLGIDLEDDGEVISIVKTDIDGSQEKASFLKYADVIPPVTATATGSAITIESANAPLQNLKLYGSTEQNGTPTPDNPIELKSVGDSGSFEVGVYGRNFLEVNITSQTSNGITYTKNSDGTITVNGTATSVSQCWFNLNVKKNLIVGETYKIKDCIVQLTKADGTQSYSDSSFVYQDTITQVKAYIENKVGTVKNNAIYQPMIYLADETDTTFEPCNKQTLTMPYTLRSVPNATNSGEALGVGETTDIVDFNKGIKTKNILKVTLDGTESMREHANGMLYVNLYGEKTNWKKFRAGCGLCDQLTNCFGVSTGNVFHIGTEGIYIGKNDSFSTVDELKAHLTTNPMTFCITSQTPIETPLTETELNAYRQLMTNKGTTNILSEADTEITYYVNKPNAQAIGSLHEQINKDYFKLQQAIISTGGN